MVQHILKKQKVDDESETSSDLDVILNSIEWTIPIKRQELDVKHSSEQFKEEAVLNDDGSCFELKSSIGSSEYGTRSENISISDISFDKSDASSDLDVILNSTEWTIRPPQQDIVMELSIENSGSIIDFKDKKISNGNGSPFEPRSFLEFSDERIAELQLPEVVKSGFNNKIEDSIDNSQYSFIDPIERIASPDPQSEDLYTDSFYEIASIDLLCEDKCHDTENDVLEIEEDSSSSIHSENSLMALNPSYIPCSCTSILIKDLRVYGPINKSYENLDIFHYAHFNESEHSLISLTYEIDSFYGYINSLTEFFNGDSECFYLQEISLSLKRLNEFPAYKYPKKSDNNPFMTAFCLGYVQGFTIIAIRNPEDEYSISEFKNAWEKFSLGHTNDAYKIHNKINSSHPFPFKIPTADKIIKAMKQKFKFNLFVHAIGQKFTPYWHTTRKDEWPKLQSGKIDFKAGKSGDLKLDFSFTVTNKSALIAGRKVNWTVWCNINLFIQLLSDKCPKIFQLFEVRRYFNYGLLDPSGVMFTLKKPGSSRILKFILYSNCKYLTSFSKAMPSGHAFEYNNIYLGILVASQMANSDRFVDFKKNTTQFIKYLDAATSGFKLDQNEPFGYRVEFNCFSHDFQEIFRDTESSEFQLVQTILQLVTVDCFLKFRTNPFAEMLCLKVKDVQINMNKAGIWGDISKLNNKINKDYLKRGLLTFVTIGIFQSIVHDIESSKFPIPFTFNQIPRINNDNKPFQIVLEKSYECLVLHIDPSIHSDGVFNEPYRGVGEGIEDGSKNHVQILIDARNKKMPEELNDIGEIAELTFYKFIVYMYYVLGVLDMTGIVGGKRQILKKNDAWDGIQVKYENGKIGNTKIKQHVDKRYLSDPDLLKLIDQLFTKTINQRKTVDAEYFRLYQKYSGLDGNGTFIGILLSKFKTLKWINNQLHIGKPDIWIIS